MVVDVVETEFGTGELFCEVSDANAVLAIIIGFHVGQPRDEQATCHVLLVANLLRYRDDVAAGSPDVVRREIRAATVDDGFFPFVLVEQVNVQRVGYASGDRYNAYREQAFLDLCTRPPEGGDVDRVDRVNAVLDEGALAPACNLAADSDVQRSPGFAEVERAVNESVEQFDTRGLREIVEATVVKGLIGGVEIG